MYATQQDMVLRFGEKELIDLTDQTGSETMDTETLERALSDASSEIDGYLAGRYKLPLSKVSPVLMSIACDIARYRLIDRPNDIIQERYKNAIRFLESIAKGLINLGPMDDGTEPSVGGGPMFSAPERVFTGSTLGDYR